MGLNVAMVYAVTIGVQSTKTLMVSKVTMTNPCDARARPVSSPLLCFALSACLLEYPRFLSTVSRTTMFLEVRIFQCCRRLYQITGYAPRTIIRGNKNITTLVVIAYGFCMSLSSMHPIVSSGTRKYSASLMYQEGEICKRIPLLASKI